MLSNPANIVVVFYSRDGSVEAVGKAVSDGAREAGAEVPLRRVPDLVSSEVMANVPGWEERSKRVLAEYGAPRTGTRSGRMKSYLAPQRVLETRRRS
jgi:NAD(P)H dehydrogenase (quinone)